MGLLAQDCFVVQISLDDVWVLSDDFLHGRRFSIAASKVIYFKFDTKILLTVQKKFFNCMVSKNFFEDKQVQVALFSSSVLYYRKFRSGPRNKIV
jgi:hypothetical protein